MSPQPPQDQPPAIRIVPHIEGPRSLHFDIIEREVAEGVVIKIGRFTDKANVPNRVTFKSKVVSRGHAEIWNEDGKFLIRDTKSSSGTFLNHNRLSAPGVESKPYPLKDGDIVQLGVDYQGGTEEIYRCVKMRVELNRSWQRQLNPFNLNALKNLKQLTGPDAFKHQTTDCCICLCGIGPCQALFVAPCSHVFHYKCIRPLLVNHHPSLSCPICRSYADLEAPIDNQVDWEQLLAEQEEVEKNVTEKTKNKTLNTDKKLPPTPQECQLMTQEEIDEQFDQTNYGFGLETSSPPSSSSAVPIPSRNRNTSDEVEDPNLILGRTLPSSLSDIPQMVFPDEIVNNILPSPQNQNNSPRLDEIAEEDEGTMSSPSTNPCGQTQNNGSSSLHELSSSSASASTSDDDDVVLGLLSNANKQKGKGVVRLEIDENERENVS
ncbi:SMAD/FHA domain-containing protein [Rhizophagus clarus]|uniref:SMAD/FHA domain-containing protein n=1 Tax=Rhizophagus clarus TaxID=94130 RepID=A0A8H3QR54_9GLOM|nr:SMAD/FHA domain-containing protein [Rhizophagus clarus]